MVEQHIHTAKVWHQLRKAGGIVIKGAVLWACVCIILCVSGCCDIEQRRLRTIEKLEPNAPDHEALPLLREATAETLRTPQIAFARVYVSGERHTLFVDWIGARPMADGLLLQAGEDEDTWQIDMHEEYIEANLAFSTRIVLYGYAERIELYEFAERNDPTSSPWKELWAAIQQGTVTARLTQNGRPVSAPAPVTVWRQSE